MCIIAFAWQLLPDYPLVLIANRDEFYPRPSTAMTPWPDAPQIIGGRDLEAGGSWLASHEDGRFAAVTNHRDGRNKHPAELSRGKLIHDYLTGTDNAAGFCAQLQPELSRYGGFNLLLGDQHGLYYQSNRGGGFQPLAPGLYGLSNALLDSPWPKTDALKQRLADYLAQHPQPQSEQLLPLLWQRDTAADSQLPDTGVRYAWEKMLSACFIQASDLNYGTRASTALVQHRNGQRRLMEQAFTAQGAAQQRHFEQQLEPVATTASCS